MKYKTQVEGKDIELEIPDEAIAQSGFTPTGNFEKELARRGLSIAVKQGYKRPEDIFTDEELKAKALEAWGIKVDPSKAGDEAERLREALERQRRDWETRELNPLKEKVNSLSEREDELLVRDMHRQIIQAAAAFGVKKALLKPTKGGVAPIVSMLETVFGFDTDTREFYVLDGEGFAFSDKPSAEHPYQTIEEFVARWVGEKDNAEFVDMRGQAGPGMATDGGPVIRGQGGNVHISKTDSRNARLLWAAQDRAKKAGVEVVIDD